MSETSFELSNPLLLTAAEAAIAEAGMLALAAWQYGQIVGLARFNNPTEVSAYSDSGRYVADLCLDRDQPCPSNSAEYIGHITARVNTRQGLYGAEVWRDKDGQFHTEFRTTVHRPKAKLEHGYYYGPYYEHAAALIIKLAAKRVAASADTNVSHMTTAQQAYQAALAKTSL